MFLRFIKSIVFELQGLMTIHRFFSFLKFSANHSIFRLMRQVISIFFLSLYLMVSSGVMVNFHLCGNMISELALFMDAHGCCPPDAEKMDNGCCSDESIYVAFDEDQHIQKFESKKIVHPLGSSFVSSFFQFEEIEYKSVSVKTANAPPILNSKIYLQLSRLKVFGDC